MTKTWARVAGRIYAFLIVPIASGLVAGALFVLSLSPAAVKQIADAAGGLSTFVPLFTVLAAAIGWFAVAALNGEEARHTERTKEEHARQGTLRQVRTLLRAALATLDPFFFLHTELQLTDVEQAYQRFLDRLNERETAISLLDDEYDALDGFVTQFGRMIAMAQRYELGHKPPPPLTTVSPTRSVWSIYDPPLPDPIIPDPSAVEARETERRHFFNERRLRFAECFRDTLPALKATLDLLRADSDMQHDLTLISNRAEETIRYLMQRVYSEPDITGIEVSVEIDSLGEWAEPIKEAIKTALAGSKPSYAPLPMGGAALYVSWPGFDDRDQTERQEMVRSAVATLGDEAPNRIKMIVALTPEEARGLGASSP
jgi:hypothetical protein